MREIAESVPLVRALLSHLSETEDLPGAREWVEHIRAAYVSRAVRGGMPKWCRERDWKAINVLVAKYVAGGLAEVRVTGPRTLRSNPLGVVLHGEEGLPIDHRYNKIASVAQDARTFVGYSSDFQRIVVYHLVDEVKV